MDVVLFHHLVETTTAVSWFIYCKEHFALHVVEIRPDSVDRDVVFFEFI